MRRSKVARLPQPLREEIERIWRAGDFTLDELLSRVRALGADVSRSSVHRYVQDMDRKMERYREAQQIAAAWVTKLGEEPQGDVGRLLAEMLKTIAFKLMADLGDETTAAAKPADVMLLAKAIKDLEVAGKTWTDRELKVREQLRTRVEKAVAEQRTRGGLSADAAERIRKALLGAAA